VSHQEQCLLARLCINDSRLVARSKQSKKIQGFGYSKECYGEDAGVLEKENYP
jgi:hypothetical protein